LSQARTWSSSLIQYGLGSFSLATSGTFCFRAPRCLLPSGCPDIQAPRRLCAFRPKSISKFVLGKRGGKDRLGARPGESPFSHETVGHTDSMLMVVHPIKCNSPGLENVYITAPPTPCEATLSSLHVKRLSVQISFRFPLSKRPRDSAPCSNIWASSTCSWFNRILLPVCPGVRGHRVRVHV
jgi:hypothetical protein